MKIEITPEYAIGADSMQWIIYRRRTEKTLRRWQAFKYYPTLGKTIDGLTDLMVRTSDAKTLEQLGDEFRKSHATVLAAVSSLKAGELK